MARRSDIALALGAVLLLAAGSGTAQADTKKATPKKSSPAIAEETLEFDASIEMPKVLKQVPPKYPEEARKRGEQGMVLVRALVKKDGTVGQVMIPPGKGATPALDRAAQECIRQWTFAPAKKKGKPVAVYVVVPVKFALDVEKKK